MKYDPESGLLALLFPARGTNNKDEILSSTINNIFALSDKREVVDIINTFQFCQLDRSLTLI